MRPTLAGSQFGSILVEAIPSRYDIYVRLNGTVKKRRKRLSREVSGTAHVVSVREVRHIYQRGAKRLIVGTGYDGVLSLSEEALAFLEKKGCQVRMLATPDAARFWNE